MKFNQYFRSLDQGEVNLSKLTTFCFHFWIRQYSKVKNQIVLGYPYLQIHLLLLMRCKFYFRLFTDDWIVTGGKHWLFSFMKEPSLFVASINPIRIGLFESV